MFRFYIFTTSILFILMITNCTHEALKGTTASNEKSVAKNFYTISNINIWQKNDENAIFFESGLKIDADGSPRAYHPEEKGLDYNYNGGSNGKWWGVVTNEQGTPYIQTSEDPAPGYYVSATSLEDFSKKISDPSRYVNAEEIPYIVLPEELYTKAQIQLGDFAAVINKSDGKIAYAIFADVGPQGKLGEGSIALANDLDIYSNPKDGGAYNNIIYIVFPGSGNGKPRSKEVIISEGEILLNEWGGKELLLSFFKEKQNHPSNAYNTNQDLRNE